MTPSKLHVLSAILAVSNMGQKLPRVSDIASLLKSAYRLRTVGHRDITLSSAVLWFAEQYMETDEHQKMFEDEAKSFRTQLKREGEIKCRKYWPDIFDMYDRADAQSKCN